MNPLLSGIRVLDLSRTVAAPTAAQMLADFGAEVIKVERPGSGDEARGIGPTFLKDRDGKPTREGSMYLAANRNKKGITADLSKPGGQELVRRLAAKSDVLVENYKVGDLARYGLDYASLRAANPRLIYCSVTGFGQSGPYSSRAGYDPIFQAMAGWLSVNGIGEQPSMVASNPCDTASGYHAAMAILAALYHRDRVSGEGQHIDIALLDVAIAAYGHRALDYLLAGEQRPRLETAGIIFPCTDGSIVISVANPRQWSAFCSAIERPELASDPRYADYPGRFKHRAVLNPILEAATRRFSVAALAAKCDEADIPAGPVYGYAQVFEDPQVKARGLAVEVPHALCGSMRLVANPIRFSATPVNEYRAPPRLGEHTEEILGGLLGLDAQAIAALREEGAI